MNEAYLSHHGILGQKWGVRRYQNYDGSLTNAGKKRASKNEKREARRTAAKAASSDQIFPTVLRITAATVGITAIAAVAVSQVKDDSVYASGRSYVNSIDLNQMTMDDLRKMDLW